MRTPTTKADLARINSMFDELAPHLTVLYGRWQDEKKYEDIADYGKNIAAALPDGFTLTKMTKGPFGFEFTIGTTARYHMKVTGRSVEWTRTA